MPDIVVGSYPIPTVEIETYAVGSGKRGSSPVRE